MSDVNSITVDTTPPPPAADPAAEAKLNDAINRTENGKADPVRPAGIPEKFKSVDELAKAYAELEKKLSTSTPKVPETPKVETPAEPKAPETPKPADLKTAEKVLTHDDFSKYSDEIIEKGDLTPESLAAIQKEYKIDEGMAKHYVELAKAANDLKAMKLAQEFGSVEKYEEVRNWAIENLSEKNMELVTKMASSSDWADVQAAVEFMQHKFNQAGQNTVNLTTGKTGGVSEGAPFNNMYEQVQAQKDPRYGRDPVYTKSVEKRIELATQY